MFHRKADIPILGAMAQGAFLYQDGTSTITSCTGLLKNYVIPGERSINIFNCSIADLYLFAFSGLQGEKLSRNRVIVETDEVLKRKIILTDKQKLDLGDYYTEEWMRYNSFCYELVLTKGAAGELYNTMLVALNHYFGGYYGIAGSWENRVVKCYELVRTSNQDKMGWRAEVRISEGDFFHLNLMGMPMQELVYRLNTEFLNFFDTPVVDGTGYSGIIDVELNAIRNNIQQVKTELQRYDLDIAETEQQLPMVVITMSKCAP